jgi:hypothetical protein
MNGHLSHISMVQIACNNYSMANLSEICPKIVLMRHILTIFILFLFAGCQSAGKKAEKPLNAELLPAGAVPSRIRVTDLNYWTEQGQFFVTGVCINESGVWEQIWLNVSFTGEQGRPLSAGGAASAVIPTFSGAVPPMGRTAFFAGWPLSVFSGVPAACTVREEGSLKVSPGAILLTENVGGVRMMVPEAPGKPASVEAAWQISAVLNNPLPQTAQHPKLELLLFGTDRKLWFSTVLDPGDSLYKSLIVMDKTGPMAGGEKRELGISVHYDQLPAALREKKIGRVELLAFDAR